MKSWLITYIFLKFKPPFFYNTESSLTEWRSVRLAFPRRTEGDWGID